ncbi:MAG: biopolymer transporter ExbD [Puniceicoccales bacterium]|jgi:biopolymer transport protein ExbD|nr:biopolymer transporter ExbD [Puniceicoccales bacterium]
MGGGGGGGDGEPEFQVAPMIDVLLVLLIFFMSITSAQVLKIDKNIKLPLALHGEKRDDKAKAALINIAWNSATSSPTFKLDDNLIDGTDTESPTINNINIVEILKQRRGTDKEAAKFRMLIRADKAVHAKFLLKPLKWGAEAGIDNIAFSGVNNELD